MTQYTYDMLEPTQDLNESMDMLGRDLADLYAKSWNADKKHVYDKQFSLNIQAFAQMWFSKTLRVFMAYDGRKPVGFLIGIVFRPMPYEASVFQIEDWYTDGDREMERGLFDYAMNAVRFIGCDEIWVAHKADHEVDLPSKWHEQNTFRLHRYVKAE